MTKKATENPLKKQMIGFALTGTLSTLIMFLIYWGLNPFIYYQYSYFIAYSISVLALYFMNTLYVFKAPISLKSFLKFPIIYILQYVIGAASLEFIVNLGFSVTFAPMLVIIILLPVTFVLNRLVLK